MHFVCWFGLYFLPTLYLKLTESKESLVSEELETQYKYLSSQFLPCWSQPYYVLVCEENSVLLQFVLFM